MTEAFDPYRSWLGISPHERPAHHYRLLGISLFEHDPAIIADAADRQMAYIRAFASGPRAVHTQSLLNELAAAKLCLLDAGREAAYDAGLRQVFAQYAPRPAPAAMPAPVPTPTAAPPAPPPPPPPTPAPGVKIAVGGPTPTPAARPAEHGPSGSSGSWMLLAAGLLLLLLAVGFTVVIIVLQNQRPQVIESKPPSDPKPAPPVETIDEPLVVHQEGDGSLNLSAVSARLFGEKVQFVHKDNAAWLDGFASPEDRVERRVQIAKPGIFRVEVTYAADAAAGSQWRLAGEKHEKRGEVAKETGGRTTFVDETVGFLALPRSGRHLIEFHPVEVKGSFLVLQKIRLVPRGS